MMPTARRACGQDTSLVLDMLLLLNSVWRADMPPMRPMLVELLCAWLLLVVVLAAARMLMLPPAVTLMPLSAITPELIAI